MLIHCHLTITKVYGLRMCADLSVQHREAFWNARGFLKISLTGFRSVCFVFSYIDYSLPVHWLIYYQQSFSSYVTCFGDWNTWMRLCMNTAFALRMCNDECNNTKRKLIIGDERRRVRVYDFVSLHVQYSVYFAFTHNNLSQCAILLWQAESSQDFLILTNENYHYT